MRLRVLDRKKAGDTVKGPEFNGIRKEDKLKAFLMTDLLTYYTYTRYAIQFFSRDDRNADGYREQIYDASHAMAVNYTGFVSGTPADQLNKRITNMISAIEGKSQPNSNIATQVADVNLGFYRNTFDSGSDGPQISVKVTVPKLARSIRDEHGYEGDGNRVAIGDLIRRIVSAYLEPSRFEPELQSVMKVQYDLYSRLFSERANVGEDIGMDLTRMYLALSCILDLDMGSVGDEYEPVMSLESFEDLILKVERPKMSENLLIVSSGSVPFDTSVFDGMFRRTFEVSGTISDIDLELELYKARIAFDFGKYNLLLIDDGFDCDISDIISGIQKRISWNPVHTVAVGCGNSGPGTTKMVCGKPDRIGEDIVKYYYTGINVDDIRTKAVVASAVRDVLSTAYPGIGEAYSEPCQDVLGLIRNVCEYTRTNRPGSENPYAELVESMINMMNRIYG